MPIDLTPREYDLKPMSRIVFIKDIAFQMGEKLGGWVQEASALSNGKVRLDSEKQQILLGEATAPLTGIGIFLGFDDPDYELRVGDPANSYFHWNGSNLIINIVSGKIDIRLQDGLNLHGSGSDIVWKVGGNHNASIRLRIGSDAGLDSEIAFAVGVSSTDVEFSFKRTAADTGNLSPVTGSTIDLGTSSLRWQTIYLLNAPDVSSAKNMKINITSLKYGLKEILQINPVKFRWKDSKDKEYHIGIFAEEIREIMPEIAPNIGSYRPTELIPVLIKSIQELKSEIDFLKEK